MKQTTIAIVRGMLWPGFYDGILKIFIFFLLVLALSANRVTAQETMPATGIAVGGALPDEIWRNTNRSFSGDTAARPAEHETNLVTLSKYRGKLILLDFWATYCVPCISNFPKMKLLQEKYRNDLKVILVNNEPVAKAAKFLQKRKSQHGEEFTAIMADTLLNKTFPHRTIPHYVWIGRNGKVLAITGEEEIEDAKLLHALAGEGGTLVNKKNIDPALPLFSSADLPREHLLRYSLLTKGRVSGMASGTQLRRAKETGVLVGRAFTNTDFFSLYGTIARVLQRQSGQRFSDKQIRFIGTDSARFLRDIYNYEFVVPERFSAKLYPMMLDDLNTYSPYAATFENQKIECLILERYGTGRVPLSGQVDEKSLGHLDEASGSRRVLSLKNVPVEVLADQLENLEWNHVPIINKTGISERISLKINASGKLPEVNAELKSYGLRLRPVKVKTTLLVIRDQVSKPTL
ncbi:thiol-disulfide isomerase/thioredoxin [Flavobacterium sp. W4I14]|nr:thiol-disulfide isomerase/thioredoxin [Flavobacterium sp. W4I14]